MFSKKKINVKKCKRNLKLQQLVKKMQPNLIITIIKAKKLMMKMRMKRRMKMMMTRKRDYKIRSRKMMRVLKRITKDQLQLKLKFQQQKRLLK